ncbi:sodium:solute symporter family protein, partial [Candidatus Sumerlaeota bacterium]|nr:sodium:solute symporter family protein [Candidatus Sumerlaeota bacterium]
YFGKDRFSDRQQVLFARGFIVLIVLITYLFSLQEPRQVFQLGIWCFSGFTGLFPLVVASIYWKRVTTPGAIASILASAAVWLILFRESDYGAIRGYLFLGMMPVATIFACATAALIGVSLLTRPPRKETIAKYFVS